MLQKFWGEIKASGRDLYVFTAWVMFGIFIGIVVGIVGVCFHFAVEKATHIRMVNPELLYLLPIGGVLIVFLYRLAGLENDRGTNFILVSVRANEKVGIWVAPLIFISSVITHLFGGSSGREGAALQLGGSISEKLGRMVGLDDKDKRIITMCGMSAAFAAVFGTPITAVVFSMEVITVGVMHYSAIVPCMVSAMIGAGISEYFQLEPAFFQVSGIPKNILFSDSWRVAVLGILCAILSIVFCAVMKKTSALYRRFFPDTMLRAFVGGILVILLTLLVGSRDYNGAGMEVIGRAIAGEAMPLAFLLKMIFTALTLGAGYKGGEIVPVFFIGATFGCVVGPVLGLPASFGAGLGMAALFCGVTNCPLSTIILSMEIFGVRGIGYFALICAISYMLSGYQGLYSEQKIMYSKHRPEFINKSAD